MAHQKIVQMLISKRTKQVFNHNYVSLSTLEYNLNLFHTLMLYQFSLYFNYFNSCATFQEEVY